MIHQVKCNTIMQQLIAKCWSDEGFKKKMLEDPRATLTAEGVELPADLSIRAVENTDKVLYLVIPHKPTELSDDDLDKVAGGFENSQMNPYRDGVLSEWSSAMTLLAVTR